MYVRGRSLLRGGHRLSVEGYGGWLGVSRGVHSLSVEGNFVGALRAVRDIHAQRGPVSVSCLSTGDRCSSRRAFSTESGEEEVGRETHTFKTETKKLLDIVTHSLYSDKQIFIRELISNASDALEKLRFLQATNAGGFGEGERELDIHISTNEVDKTFTIEDTGVGMSREELIENLGTIAKSGSLNFIKNSTVEGEEEKNNIIGKFGVGFYSSFVVAHTVDVYSKKYDDVHTHGWKWSSQADGSFTIQPSTHTQRGTKIVLWLDEKSTEFSDLQNVEKIAEKYSAFVNFPLYVQQTSDTPKLINKQQALWLKQTHISDDEHTQFFRFLSGNSHSKPLYQFTFKSEIPLNIKSIFYIPEEPPSRLFQSKTEVGISLHSRRVMVKKSADEIIPKWLFFVKGVIDCDDLPLNVSRESLQDMRLIENLSTSITRRLLRFLEDESKADTEKYMKFYDGYSYFLKEGFLDETSTFKKHHDTLLKLLRFECTYKDKGELISLDEYIQMMKPNQQNIYYFYASDRPTALASPYIEQFTKKNRNVLLLYEDIDEFLAMKLQNFKDKKFVSIDSSEDDFEPQLEENESHETDTQIDKKTLTSDQQKELEEYIKSVLGEKVSGVKYSDRLVSSPAIITGFLSSSLRKMMKITMRSSPQSQMGLSDFPATLELNPSHPVIISLHSLQSSNPDIAKMITEQIYDNASIAAGIMEDPRKMLTRLNKFVELMSDKFDGQNGDELRDDSYNKDTHTDKIHTAVDDSFGDQQSHKQSQHN